MPNCLFNQQALSNQTTGFNQRSLTSTYQTTRHSREAKTDGTYFLTNMLGGDHSLKFGLGWRRNPISTFSHYSGGARAICSASATTATTAATAATCRSAPRPGSCRASAVLYRDTLLNNDWWTYNGYIQDSYSRGRVRINGGLRYDWQTSKWLGGCVPNNPLRPDLLPSQCEDATDTDPLTGNKIQSFGNWSPRISVIYDLLRQRQDVGPRELLVLLQHEDHAGQRARRPAGQPGADLGQQPDQRRVQHDRRRPLLDRREPGRPRADQRAHRHAERERATSTSRPAMLCRPATRSIRARRSAGRASSSPASSTS